MGFMICIKAVFEKGDSTSGDEKPESNVHQRPSQALPEVSVTRNVRIYMF